MEQTIKKPKFISQYLIGINVIIFAIMFLTDMKLSPDTLITFGAKVNYKIADGELYRFISPMFLHWDFYHLGANMLSLYIFGRDIEIIFGRKKFLPIYFFSGIIGVLFSYTFNNSISAGASGAIFGLLGAHLYLFFRNKDAYKKVFGRDFLILIAINVGYGIFDPRIDFSGHMGGLIGGMIICYLLGIKREKNLNFKKIIAIILTLFAFSSTFVFRTNTYLLSENYFIAKSIDVFYEGRITESIDIVSDGLVIHPNSSNLNQLLLEINNIAAERK